MPGFGFSGMPTFGCAVVWFKSPADLVLDHHTSSLNLPASTMSTISKKRPSPIDLSDLDTRPVKAQAPLSPDAPDSPYFEPVSPSACSLSPSSRMINSPSFYLETRARSLEALNGALLALIDADMNNKTRKFNKIAKDLARTIISAKRSFRLQFKLD